MVTNNKSNAAKRRGPFPGSKWIHPNTCPELYNLLNVVEVTDQPIIVHDIDNGDDYDITGLIRSVRKELGLD